jgi:hypothetical protein
MLENGQRVTSFREHPPAPGTAALFDNPKSPGNMKTAQAMLMIVDAERRRRIPGVSQRKFSVDDANDMLPLVRRIARDIVSLSTSLRHLVFRLKFVTAGGEIEQMFPREIAALRNRIGEMQTSLEKCLDELEELGVEPELPTLGLFDFPSIMESRPAYLCWMHDEPAVAWWHSDRGGFVDRQPLAEGISRSPAVSNAF